MTGKLFPVFFVLVSAAFAALSAYYTYLGCWVIAIGSVIGAVLGIALLLLIRLWLASDAVRILGGTIGSLAGALVGFAVGWPVSQVIGQMEVAQGILSLLMLAGIMTGMRIGSAKIPEIRASLMEPLPQERKVLGILDTSVIIDGRIADVCETGFLTGDLIIPEFVLKELQAIADSSESVKRTRGRRGLDILHKMQKQSYVTIIISSTDYPSVKEVDQKLINMGRETGSPILTNDFNLNKVAEVHSIQVLNMNQLANALKPVVLPGETIRVQIIKEGKEYGQGVAYLDDGTMVVVDSGRQHMGKTMDVVVTSVLQTTAGRMIFGAVKG